MIKYMILMALIIRTPILINIRSQDTFLDRLKMFGDCYEDRKDN
jgi:hypothetical protein